MCAAAEVGVEQSGGVVEVSTKEKKTVLELTRVPVYNFSVKIRSPE